MTQKIIDILNTPVTVRNTMRFVGWLNTKQVDNRISTGIIGVECLYYGHKIFG